MNKTKKLLTAIIWILVTSLAVKANTITSTQSGNWSSISTWGGRLPNTGDSVIINNVVTLDQSASVGGLVIQAGSMLLFDPTRIITLQSTKNIIVYGELKVAPNDYNITHLIQFVGIDEAKVIGSSMDPLPNDIGLWVVGDGILNLQGSYKTPFAYSVGQVSKGDNLLILKDSTFGWKAGDELTIAPTANGSNVFDESVILSITSDGKTVFLNSDASTIHPVVNKIWTAEVINLTRNVRIEGTATGRAHVFIRSTQTQHIEGVQLRYVGPRKQQSGSSVTELIVGRYGIHFHHCMMGSIGSVVTDCVIRDAGNHAYVPHMSDGITMSENVAYKCLETPFWWDVSDPTNDVQWLDNIVAAPGFLDGSIGTDTDGAPTFGVNGFILGLGDGNICNRNTVVGQIDSNDVVNGAFDWEEMNVESAWEFKDNIAHNCCVGLKTWQNNQKNHVIQNTTLYNNRVGVLHGAYGNNYTYDGGYFYASEFQDHAGSQENGVRLENITLDGGNSTAYPFHVVNVDANIKGVRPILLVACNIIGGKSGAILDESSILKNVDLINCNIVGAIKNTSTVETIRVQPYGGQAYQVKKAGTTNIVSFAPASWGYGDGLTGQYFNGIKFDTLALTRVDPIVLFEEWNTPIPGNNTGVHYSINSSAYSIRYTGYIQPQYSEPYVFSVATGGGVRIYVNNVLILNKWSDPYPTTYSSSTINLKAGVQYPIRIEYFNTDDKSNLTLYWKSTSLKKEVVPQSQLYSK